MNTRDRILGMGRAISRRDFLNGIGGAIGASMLPACSKTDSDVAVSCYPPSATGMRGSHPGSFEVAHALVQGQRFELAETGEQYDLVVVGAGISGLSAAYIYRRDVKPDARILILDNHDDFGGHAKRNEFTYEGRTFIGFGGTMLIEAPRAYPAAAKRLIRELGIDTARSAEFHHEEHLASLGLARGTFFDKETFGADYLAIGHRGLGDAIRDAPLSATGRQELERLMSDDVDYLAGMNAAERGAVVESHSWAGYLQAFGGFGDELLTFVQKWPHGVWAIGADALPAWIARADSYPGFAGVGSGYGEDDDESDAYGENFLFPDGNASVARLLVRKLIPGVAPGDTLDDIVTARFDYAELDRPRNRTRIRLSSTVVGLQHRDGKLDTEVDVSYVSDGEGRRISAGKVVWAGYHSMLPYVCPDLPPEQAAAQASSVRAPLVYTTVLIRNWRSLVKLGLRRVYCPGSFFQTVMLSHPVSIGEHRFATSPDEPVVLHLQHMPLQPGLPAAEQFRAGRRRLLQTPFETFERNVRDQLGRLLGPGGFDPARDILGITVNRWPHGYAYSVDAASGDIAWWPEQWPHERRPWFDARQRVGNIAIAGIDAASNAMTEAAIEEAQRAVHEL